MLSTIILDLLALKRRCAVAPFLLTLTNKLSIRSAKQQYAIIYITLFIIGYSGFTKGSLDLGLMKLCNLSVAMSLNFSPLLSFLFVLRL